MPVQFEVASNDQHFEQILALQRQNLLGALSAEQQAREGYVFAKHNLAVLKKMAAQLPQIIALHQGEVIGYNLAMLPSMKQALPSLTPMFEEFEKSAYQGRPLQSYPFVVGGQVCVARAFRGQGLLQGLYHATRDRVSRDYQLCVTEIAANNIVSLHAHKKMGFQTIRSYREGTNHWDIVAWEWPRP